MVRLGSCYEVHSRERVGRLDPIISLSSPCRDVPFEYISIHILVSREYCEVAQYGIQAAE